MELRERRSLIIVFAGAGSILMWLAGTDFLTRPGFPPRQPPATISGAAGFPTG